MKFSRVLMTAVAALTIAGLSGGCAYRADLAQGNFVEQSAVDKLRVGMTPVQVRFILGTPMLIDPFDSSRWYYVHYLRKGWSDPEIENLILLFQNGVLIDMQGDFTRPTAFASAVDPYAAGSSAPASEDQQ